ncbi:MAG TPA: AsmA family protein [Planctomycetota bacterium]|nr:AsmA family protein [Planctomycetota bacterium]
MSTKLREPAREKKAAASEKPACTSIDRSRRRFRRATIILAILLALPILLLLAAVLWINPIIRKTTEKLTTDALGLPVAIEDVGVNLAGRVRLQRLAVGNPLPFKEVRSFRLGRADAAVSLPSLFNQTIEVQDLTLENPELIVEFDKDKTNWGAIFDNLVKASKAPKSSEGRKFVIHRVRLVHPVVVVHAKEVPNGVRIRLRDIELRDVGTAGGSESPTYLVLATLFQALIAGAVNQWTGAPGNLGSTLEADVARGAKPFNGKLTPAEK